MRIRKLSCTVKTHLVLVGIVTLGAGSAWSEERLSGAGAQSCAVLMTPASSEMPDGRAAIQWALGYLTGRYQAAPSEPHRPFHGPDGIVLDLMDYCRSHPGDQVADAAASFFEPQGPRQ